MTPAEPKSFCQICEAQAAPATGLRLCADCAAHPVLVAVWKEGVVRRATFLRSSEEGEKPDIGVAP